MQIQLTVNDSVPVNETRDEQELTECDAFLTARSIVVP